MKVDVLSDTPLIICYETQNSSTHSICWDIYRNIILDPDVKNTKPFSYTAFSCTDAITTEIMTAICTTTETPCILYIAYWKKKIKSKKGIRTKKMKIIADQMNITTI